MGLLPNRKKQKRSAAAFQRRHRIIDRNGDASAIQLPTWLPPDYEACPRDKATLPPHIIIGLIMSQDLYGIYTVGPEIRILYLGLWSESNILLCHLIMSKVKDKNILRSCLENRTKYKPWWCNKRHKTKLQTLYDARSKRTRRKYQI